MSQILTLAGDLIATLPANRRHRVQADERRRSVTARRSPSRGRKLAGTDIGGDAPKTSNERIPSDLRIKVDQSLRRPKNANVRSGPDANHISRKKGSIRFPKGPSKREIIERAIYDMNKEVLYDLYCYMAIGRRRSPRSPPVISLVRVNGKRPR